MSWQACFTARGGAFGNTAGESIRGAVHLARDRRSRVA